jgi:hypothetical protein
MNEKLAPALIAIFFGLMPLWITFVINPLWTVRTKKTIITVLVSLDTALYINTFAKNK